MGKRAAKRIPKTAPPPGGTPSLPIPNSARWVPPLIVAALAILAYIPALRGGYIWDDESLTENLVIQHPAGLGKIWFHPSEYREYEEHYWPLVYSTFWIEHKLWGLNPAGYHGVNVLLHAANCILIGLILVRSGGRGAWLAAALFAVHPVHVESVAWVMQRKDLLSGFFYLGAFLFYIGYESKHSRLQYSLACLCLIFAMLSKSVAVSLPAALALWIWWRKARLTLRDWFPLLPLVGIAFVMALADYLWVRGHGIDPSGLEWWARPLLAARAVLFYSGKLIVPLKLMAIYPRWTIVPTDAVYLLGLLAILITFYLLRHRIGKAPIAAILFYGLTLAPVLGGLDFGFMKFSFVADRFQYLASSGPIALAAAGMVAGRKRLSGWSIPAPVHWSLLCVLFAMLGSLTWRQAALYKDRETLFRDNLAKNDKAWLADYHVGYALSRAKKYDEAIEYYKRAIMLNPAYADAYGSLGLAQLKIGKTEEAVANMLRAIELKPGKVDSLNNLGIVFFQQGRLDQAVDYFQRAIAIMPNSVEALDNLAFIYLKQGKGDEAHALLLKALACRPGDPRASEYMKMLEPPR